MISISLFLLCSTNVPSLSKRGESTLVTGGCQGIGLAIARKLVEEGCNVAITARKGEKLAEAAAELKEQGTQSLAIKANVLVPSDIQRVMSTIRRKWSALHSGKQRWRRGEAGKGINLGDSRGRLD